MQINVVDGNKDVFNMLLFPEQNQANQLWIQNQLNNFSSTLTDIGSKFLESSAQLYEKINDSNAMRAARAAIRSAQNVFRDDVIREINNIEDARRATPIMQRWLMAEPELRKKYNAQTVDGYSDTYIDTNPGTIKESHYDYRRVMDEMVVYDDENDSWTATTYIEDLKVGDRDLTIDEKVTILNTWDLIRLALKSDMDPTDISS